MTEYAVVILLGLKHLKSLTKKNFAVGKIGPIWLYVENGG